MQNLNRARGVDPDGGSGATGVNRADLQAAKKLKKYVIQLTYAKKECDRILQDIGWDLGYSLTDDEQVFVFCGPYYIHIDYILLYRYLNVVFSINIILI